VGPSRYSFQRKLSRVLPQIVYDSDHILDFGGGNGNNRFFFKGFQLIGFDIDESRIRHIKEKSNYFVTDGMFVGLKNECVDFIFCNWVLEYIPDPNAALREIFRLLRPGGRAYLGVPTKLCRIVNEGAAVPWRLIGGRKNIMLPEGGEEIFFSIKELEKILLATNFKGVETHQTAGICISLLKLFMYYFFYIRVLMVKILVMVPYKIINRFTKDAIDEDAINRLYQRLRGKVFPSIDVSMTASENDYRSYLHRLRNRNTGWLSKAYVTLMNFFTAIDERVPSLAFEIAVIAKK
jgi:SAM-dependent methyltransferase